MKMQMRSILSLLLVVVALLCVVVVHGSEEVPVETSSSTEAESVPAAPLLDFDTIKALPIKQLRKFLAVRGLECKGCSEKDDYVQMAFDHRDSAVIDADATGDASKAQKKADVPADGEKMDPEALNELMAKLKMNGFGNSKMFSADDFKNMSPEEMSEKLNGKAPKFPKKKTDKKTTDKKTEKKSDKKTDKKAEKKTSSAKKDDKKAKDDSKKDDKKAKESSSKKDSSKKDSSNSKKDSSSNSKKKEEAKKKNFFERTPQKHAAVEEDEETIEL